VAAAGRAASPNSAFAPGRAIRGGIPIVFPWFGPSRHTPTAPQHGFARTTTWHLDGVESADSGSLTLTLSLDDGDVGSPFWLKRFRAIYSVTFAQTLSLRLAVQNRAMHPIVFEEALHNCFAISDVAEIAISGLTGTTYIDKTDAARRKVQIARWTSPALGQKNPLPAGDPNPKLEALHGTDSSQTPRWREMDSNPRSRAAGTLLFEIWTSSPPPRARSRGLADDRAACQPVS
jgi:hypothetical protein